MNKKYYSIFLISTLCSTTHTAHNTYTEGIIPVGTSKEVVHYSRKDISNFAPDWPAAKTTSSPLVPLRYNNERGQPTTDKAVMTHLIIQESHYTAQEISESQPHWFIDDKNTKRYGVAVKTDCDEPLFMLEEHCYCSQKRTLYEELDPPSPKPSILNDTDKNQKTPPPPCSSNGSKTQDQKCSLRSFYRQLLTTELPFQAKNK